MRQHQIGLKVAKVFKWQLLITLAISALFLIKSTVIAYSILLGALLFLLPNLYFFMHSLGDKKGQTASKLLGEMYKNQIWKMLFSGLLFGLVFKFIQPLSAFSLFLSFILLYLSFWLAQVKLVTRS